MEVTVVPAGRVERLNLMKARVDPAPEVAPTCNKGAEPKFTDEKALLTCASSLGEMVCPTATPGTTTAMAISP
jgi:hypothetical protein